MLAHDGGVPRAPGQQRAHCSLSGCLRFCQVIVVQSKLPAFLKNIEAFCFEERLEEHSERSKYIKRHLDFYLSNSSYYVDEVDVRVSDSLENKINVVSSFFCNLSMRRLNNLFIEFLKIWTARQKG